MKKMLLWLFLGLFPVTALAEGLPDYYPSLFHLTGKITFLDLAHSTLVLRDTTLSIPANVNVATPTKRYGTVEQLKVGQKVGCMIDPDTSGKWIVTGIWILPDG